jgi:hypothetical protein
MAFMIGAARSYGDNADDRDQRARQAEGRAEELSEGRIEGDEASRREPGAAVHLLKAVIEDGNAGFPNRPKQFKLSS